LIDSPLLKGLDNLIDDYLQGLKIIISNKTNANAKNLDRSTISNPSLSMSKINLNTQTTAVKKIKNKIK